MSDQTKREAAARAFLATGRSSDDEDVFGAVIDAAGGGWFLPNGVDSDKYDIGWDDIIGAWAFHVRALDAANAAPVAPDPLAGVVWRSPWAVYVFHAIAGGGPLMHPDDTDVLDSVARGVAANVIAAHARAQLDAAATECADAGYHAHAQLAREAKAAPVAVTLEDATTAALAAELERRGGTVTLPKVGGYDRPDLALALMVANLEMPRADQVVVFSLIRGKMDRDEWITAYRAEIGRLRALGVAPAVLS